MIPRQRGIECTVSVNEDQFTTSSRLDVTSFVDQSIRTVSMKMRLVGAVREPPLRGIFIHRCDFLVMWVYMN
ncbi:MAG: hypothetical protein C4527_13810 [Candidatus Omnitrophota bacterium]|nr:MAG: hypothetical protein C4527_13810 [Candidatus Omnitrophota bacterium]